MVMSLIESLTRIKNAVYGREVREAIHDGVFRANQIADGADAKADNTKIRQDAVEDFNNQVIQEMTDKDVISAPEIIQARGGKPTLQARLDDTTTQLAQIAINVKNPPYPLVGAVGDGVTDDSEALLAIHTFANNNKLNVNYGNNKYFIGQCLNIPIRTNTNFEGSDLIFDESKATTGNQVGNETNGFYVIPSENGIVDITNDVNLINLASEWKKGVKSLPSLSNYNNHYVYVENSNQTLVKRSMGSNDYILTDHTVIGDDSGAILYDTCFDFTGITKVEVKELEKTYLEISGGNILTNGQTSTVIGSPYKAPLFLVQRNKTRFSNVRNGLLEGFSDTSTQPSRGFIKTSKVVDFELNNVEVLPRIPYATTGTYGLGFKNSINVRLNNVTGIKEGAWGVMQSENLKNFYVKNSILNRLDSHLWGHNWYIENSHIIGEPLTLFGGGDLVLDNVKVSSDSYIVLRPDYGANWDGDLIIRNGELHVKGSTSPYNMISSNNAGEIDFERESVVFNSIKVDGFKFVFNDSTLNGDIRLVYMSTGSTTTNDVFLANKIDLRDIDVVGRDRKINRGVLTGGLVKSKRQGAILGDINTFKENSNITFQNVSLIKDAPTISINSSEYIPKIDITGSSVNVYLNSGSYLKAVDSDIIRMNIGSSRLPVIYLKDSQIKGEKKSSETNIFSTAIGSEKGHLLVENCMFHAPLVDGVKDLTSAGMNNYNILRNTNITGWVKDCKVSDEIIDSGLYGYTKGQGGTMNHWTYLNSFEQARYSGYDRYTHLPINDAEPSDGVYYKEGTILWSDKATPLGWKCTKSGIAGGDAVFVSI